MNEKLIKLAEMHGYDWIIKDGIFFLCVICSGELKSFFNIDDLLNYLGYKQRADYEPAKSS